MRAEIGVVEHFGNNEREFVAAQPRQMNVPRCAEPRQSLADYDEEPIAGRMAVEVVHGLEAVEVDDSHGKPAAAPLGRVETLLQGGEETALVGQIGQAVEFGKPKVLIAERFGP